MASFLHDLSYALRALRRGPGFAATVVATLAIGVGANTAIFSIVRGVLLRDLPYRDASRLAVVWEDLLKEGNHRFSVAAPNFEDLSARSRSFEALAAQLGTGFSLTGSGETPEAVSGAQVTGNFFSVLGARPALGRVLLPADAGRGKPARVAVLGHALWKRRFAEDAGIVGRTILLSDVPHEIVGVMPPDFDAPSQLKAPNRAAEIWTPLDLPPAWNARGVAVLQVIGRLRPGVSVETADAEVATVAGALAKEYPVSNGNIGMHVIPLSRQLFGEVRPALLVLFGAVGFVLLVVCANIAHLLLVRVGARRREIAIRVALGASRGRIVTAFLAEGLVLAAAGGALAWVFVLATRSALLAAAPPEIPRLAQVRPDAAVVAFAFLAALGAGRGFDDRDRSDSLPTALVNGAMAARFWPGESPVGKRLAIGLPARTWYTVACVVGDVSHDGIDAAPLPEVYFPLAQNADSGLNLVVRSSADPGSLPSVLRREVAALDPNLPLIDLRPMEDRISDALAQPRFLLQAFAGFAALSLLLSALALFALVANDAQRRRREIGIRMALGARTADIVRLFLSRAAALVGIGVAIGLAGALVLTRLLVPALHGTRPDDPRSLAGSACLLAAGALLAAVIPAHRATKRNPIETLKHE